MRDWTRTLQVFLPDQTVSHISINDLKLPQLTWHQHRKIPSSYYLIRDLESILYRSVVPLPAIILFQGLFYCTPSSTHLAPSSHQPCSSSSSSHLHSNDIPTILPFCIISDFLSYKAVFVLLLFNPPSAQQPFCILLTVYAWLPIYFFLTLGLPSYQSFKFSFPVIKIYTLILFKLPPVTYLNAQ